MKFAVALLMSVLSASPLAAQGVHYEGSASFSSGRYGGTATLTQFAVNSGLALNRGAWDLRFTVPLYVQNNAVLVSTGGGRVAGGGGGDRMATGSWAIADSTHMGGPGAGTGTETLDGYETGFGDPIVSLSSQLPLGFPYSARAGVSVKVPLAESAFGTGAWDAGVSLDASRWLGRHVVGVGVAWWAVGDVPGYGLRSPWLGNVMLSRVGVAGGTASLGFFLSTPAQDGLDPAASASLSYARNLGLARMIATVGAGFTDSTPAVSGSLGWRVGLR